MDGLNTVPPDQECAQAHRGKVGRFSDLIKPQHKRTAKMLGYTLFLGDAVSYGGLSLVARRHLSLTERGGVACAFLGSLPDDCAAKVAATVLGRAGKPLPPLLWGMDEARHWASWATDCELKAYSLASYEAMSQRDQAAFLRHVSAREVA